MTKHICADRHGSMCPASLSFFFMYIHSASDARQPTQASTFFGGGSGAALGPVERSGNSHNGFGNFPEGSMGGFCKQFQVILRGMSRGFLVRYRV